MAGSSPALLHTLPGRVRLHRREWLGADAPALERAFERLPGVVRARASGLTGNVLVEFDERLTDGAELRARAADIGGSRSPSERPLRLEPVREARWSSPRFRPSDFPHRTKPDRGGSPDAAGGRAVRSATGRLRAPVRGLQDDPGLARRIEERLAARPGVRAKASPLTGRVLIEWNNPFLDRDTLLEEIEALAPEPAAPPDEGLRDPVPEHPAVPLVQLVAAAAGLVVLAVAASRGSRRASPGALRVAGVITVFQGVAPLDRALEQSLGRTGAEVVVTLPKIVVLTLAGSPLGLVLAGAEALHLWAAVRQLSRPAGPAAGRPGPPAARPVPSPPREPAVTPMASYLRGVPWLTAVAAGMSLLTTRSGDGVLAATLLFSPRPALVGARAARAAFEARLDRLGIARLARDRAEPVHPDLLIVDEPGLLMAGQELDEVVALGESVDAAAVHELAASVAWAAGAPWARAIGGSRGSARGSFDGVGAEATVDGVVYRLGPAAEGDDLAERLRGRHAGRLVLVLRRADRPVGAVVLRPRLREGAEALVSYCRERGVAMMLRTARVAGARRAADRLGIDATGGTALEAVRSGIRRGKRVALLSARPAGSPASAALAEADLAIGIGGGNGRRRGDPGPVHYMIPDLGRLPRLLDALERHARVRLEAVGVSAMANSLAAVLAFRRGLAVGRISLVLDAAGLAALASAWVRLQRREEAVRAREMPAPETGNWAERALEEILEELGTTPAGLSSDAARARGRAVEARMGPAPLRSALVANLVTPLTGFLGAAVVLTLAGGVPADAAVMGFTLLANVAIGTWQEYQVDRAASSLRHLSAPAAAVLRDGGVRVLPAREVVRGDVLVVRAGDRIAADARLLEATGLEVDESTLTGESVPASKAASAMDPNARMLLQGTDVVVGHGRAVVVAVGRETLMGATVTSLEAEAERGSPLAARLSRLFANVLPATAAAGAVVTLAGVARGQPLIPQVITGASVALAALPEAVPILAGMGQAAAARRLAKRGVLVRRTSAVEALGRVDVACVDKTGTLTEGHLRVSLVVDCDGGGVDPRASVGSADLVHVLRMAALASPHPEAGDARAHSTDIAVLTAAELAGLGAELRQARSAEARFDPARSFHAARVDGIVAVKGAPEVLLGRCSGWKRHGRVEPLDPTGRRHLSAAASRLARRGLRVILVAEGAGAVSVEEPDHLTALGFIGITDPLRSGVPAAVARCHAAGIRVVMLTGDHPDTARAIAGQAGLLEEPDGRILTGPEIAELDETELDPVLDRVTVIARATPLDKVHIIEGLRRRGHAIAMTGDGVNDAPALRLADAGVAMGRGTEVARQAADLVLTENDFEHLVEALVEGRGFWRNLRRSLGLLLGGNFGELAYMITNVLAEGGGALTVRQILATNLITDALPAFAVVVQPPEHRRLDALEREGAASLGPPLRQEIVRRATATSAPALAASALARGLGTGQARTVGLVTIIGTQLALTVQSGNVHGGVSRPVVAGVAASAAALGALLAVPPLRSFFQLTMPGPLGWTLVGGSIAVAPLISSAMEAAQGRNATRMVPAPSLRPLPSGG